jgi:predicted ATPase
VRELAAQFLALAEKQKATGPVMVGHRLMGSSLLSTGDLVGSQVHLNKAISLYDRAEHLPLATRFGQDVGVVILLSRSYVQWLLGYPAAALADGERAVKDAREVGQVATLIYALRFATWTHILCGDYVTANDRTEELGALVDKKRAVFWKGSVLTDRGYLLVLTNKASNAVDMITSGMRMWKSSGTTTNVTLLLPHLASAYARVGQFHDAWHYINEALTIVKKTKETWCEAEVHRTAGEVTLVGPKPDAAKAEAYFKSALAVARQQQAKSWELRAAMSMARLWRDQGKGHEARDLLAPVYGWFTEGFETRDLKEAKALLDELAA